MKTALIYFSATGNTAKIAKIVKESLMELEVEVDEHNVTSYSDRQKKIDLSPYQTMIFGAPIHSWRAPRVVREWMRTLDGQGKKCSMFFTYGGFGVHPSHYSTRNILEEQNFVVVSSAEFLGAHTYNLGGWKSMENRPHKSDFETAKEYVQKTYKRFTGEDTGILGELERTQKNDEFLDQIEGFRFKIVTQLPDRNGEECSMCMECEELCPTGAIKAETGKVDKEKCICCLRCVANCPDGILKTNDLSASWLYKLDVEKTDEETLKSLKSRIYL